jgi:hypothetical protein
MNQNRYEISSGENENLMAVFGGSAALLVAVDLILYMLAGTDPFIKKYLLPVVSFFGLCATVFWLLLMAFRLLNRRANVQNEHEGFRKWVKVQLNALVSSMQGTTYSKNKRRWLEYSARAAIFGGHITFVMFKNMVIEKMETKKTSLKLVIKYYPDLLQAGKWDFLDIFVEEQETEKKSKSKTKTSKKTSKKKS